MKLLEAREGKVALIVALLCCLLPLYPFFSFWEAKTEDLRFALRGTRPTKARIVLAPISDDTLDYWKNEPLVLWGGHLTLALKGAQEAGAIAIGVDYIPAVDADEYLHSIVEEVFRLDNRAAAFTAFEARMTDSPYLQPNTTLMNFLRAHPNLVVLADNGKLIEPLRTVGAPLARVDLPPQRDGAVRTMAWEADETPYFASALATLMGIAPHTKAAFGLNYVSTTPHTFRVVPFENLAAPSPAEKALLQGACVLIGADYRGSNDLHSGLLGQEFTGLELHGHALATLLDGNALERGSPWTEVLWTLVVALLGLMALRLRFLWGTLVNLTLLLAWSALAQQSFTQRSFWLPLAAPALGLILPLLAFHLSRALTERQNRRLVERVFGQYLSPTVRDYLLAAPENRELGGREAEATVLFFDLRGSTAFAEGRPPREVLTELNRLFSQIVPLFRRHEGTVLRYSGDGFLAVFGAPTPDPAHAAHALLAAQEVTRELARWNAIRASEGLFLWHFGIGLHSGTLIWGSLGSAERPELTLIGDTVNVAARLQEATKALGAVIVLSEETWKEAGCPPVQGPRLWEIRGRQEALQVYFQSSLQEE